MYLLRGLTRDPFAPVCDGSLFWESRPRAQARCTALEILLSGTGVWLSGPPGSGRSTLLAVLAEEIAQGGRRVLWTEPAAGLTPEQLLARMVGVVSASPTASSLLDSAETLYAQMLEGFCAAGTVICFPGLEEPTVGTLAEAAILARFRIAGRPIAALALSGEGEPPFAGLHKIPLPPPSTEDLEACLRHRTAVCGNARALPHEDLTAIAASSRSFGDALEKARQALARTAFLAGAPSAGRNLPGPPIGSEPRANVLDRAMLDELSGLLDSLSPKP